MQAAHCRPAAALAIGLILMGTQPIVGAWAKSAEGTQKRDTANKDGDDRSEKDDQSEKEEVDTENLFGFSEGAETGKKGEQEVLVDSQMRFSKRRAGPGRPTYGVANTRITYQFDPTDTFSIEFSLFNDIRRVRNVVDLPDKSFSAFDGGSLELKYAFQKSSPEQPLGIAIETRPHYERVMPIEGRGADLFDVDTQLQVDLRLVPDRLWYGSNLGFDPSVGRVRGSGETDRSSNFLWSHALALRVGDNTFLGTELRYLRAYDGTFLNRFEGHAVYLGPTLYHTFPNKTYLALAYLAQVAGHARDPDLPGRSFDLTSFERHAVRVKLGVEF